MKRILAMLLAVLMLVCCLGLVSCGDEEEKKPNTGGSQSSGNIKDDEELKIDISDAPLEIPEDSKSKYEGKTFVIDSPQPWGKDRFVREDYNDDPLNDSIKRMNDAVLDTIGVTLDATMNTYTPYQAKTFVDSVLANDGKFDVMAVHTESNCAALVIADAVLNFDYLEYCDLSKPWWNAGFTESSSILDVNYFGVSSSCYAIYLNTVVLLFNKDLAAEHNLPDFYQLVRDGKWTVDELINATKNFTQDLDGDGLFNENDQIAMVSDDGPHINSWLGAFRQSTVTKGENDEPTIVVNTARMSNIIDKLHTLYNTGRRTTIYPISWRESSDNSKDIYNNAFAEGRVLFDIAYIDEATKMRDYDINFGILPMPKLNLEQEEYGSYVEAWHLCYAVPKNCEDTEYVSTVLETMAYYSYQYTYPTIIEQTIYGTGTRDIESSEMLDIVFKNMEWEFGYIYNGNETGYAYILKELINKGSTDMASFIASRKNQVEDHFADLYDAGVSNSGK